MSGTTLAWALGEAGVHSAPGDHAADGFHHRHQVAAAALPEVARAFVARGFFLEMLTCEDRRADLDAMRLVYTFNRFEVAERHVVFATVPFLGEAPSLCGVTRAADWMEREVYDMYGVRFAGHPDLKRLLLPDDADFHALLKDFGRMEDAVSGGGGGR
jgi:NADH-quinone oxidoreductase subunit C